MELYGWRENDVRWRGSVGLAVLGSQMSLVHKGNECMLYLIQNLVIRKPSFSLQIRYLFQNCAGTLTSILSSAIDPFNMALSTFNAMASVFSIPVHVPSARTQLAFVNMNTDAIHPTRGASVEGVQNQLRKRTAS